MNIAAIGIGQGGANLADALATMFSSPALGVINLSDSDLKAARNVASENRLLLGGRNVDGAGKDRNFSKGYFGSEKDEIINFAHKIINIQPQTDVVFVCFSTSGGTGSGLGPAVSTLLKTAEFQNRGHRSPLVFGVAACADSTEGIKNQYNTIEALSEISKLSENKLARFILVNNDIQAQVIEHEKKYATINETTAKLIHRYFNEYNNSRYGCLDRQDRVVALKYPGVHSFCVFNPADASEISSPFILPEGARVMGLRSEVLEGAGPKVDDIVIQLGVQIDDKTNGYYEPTVNTSSVIHFAGFSNLKKVTERYQNIISQIQSRAAQAEKNDKTLGSGFTRMNENKTWMDKSYSPAVVASADDILGLLG